MRSLAAILKTLVAVGLVAPALGLVFFGPRGAREVPDDRVVVTYWEKWTDFEGEAMKRLVGVFNDTVGRERGIFVDYVVTTQIELKSLVAIAGGDPPDLAGLWPHNVSSYASRGALQVVTPQAAASGIDANLILPVYYKPCFYHGEQYAVPLTPWSLALYYNKGIFREAADAIRAEGYDPEQPPRTLDALSAYSRAVLKRGPNDRIERLGFIMSVPEKVGWYYHTWGLWAGGDFIDHETGRPRFDSPAWIAGYEFVQQYVRQFGTRDVLRFEDGLANFNSPDNPFMIGKLAMVQQGPWFANMVRQYAPDIDLGVAPFPSHDGSPISYCGQDLLVIPTGARHPKEAWVFVDWLYNAPPLVVSSGKAEPQFGYEFYLVQTPSGPERRPMPPLRPIEWICWNHYKNSPLLHPTPAFVESHPNPGIRVHEDAARSPLARTEPPLPNWWELQAEFTAAYRDIWAGNVDAAPRLAACQKRIDILVEQARRRQARHGDTYP